MAQESRQGGRVKWFSGQKGFGFISPDDGGEDLFVHQTSIRSDGFRTLSEGDPVEFSVEHGDDGRNRAVDVTGPDGSTIPPSPAGGGRGSYGSRSRGGWYGGGYGRGYGGYALGPTGSGYECYNCGRIGHFARDCDYGNGVGGVSAGGRFGGRGFSAYSAVAGGGTAGGGGGGGGGGRCYNCGEFGHFARDCPNEERP